ncbi:PREDICTED: uncharacterized protein LOC107334784 [Acropora digitifera]|uniref:uncharacterized protein LOC107334784 n=1 Tax=Acropora digitifera TaxID=70779 RepID=UPI00077A80E1|nr:PREDICTED: uncharacterized protein LOC107334784 [Acropora digitifera]
MKMKMFRVKRFCVRNAVRNTRLEVVMKDIKPPNIVNVQTVKCLFDSAVLNEFVKNTVLKLKENKAHPEILRQELSSYRFESPDEDRYQQLRDIFEGYTKNGSVEEF